MIPVDKADFAQVQWTLFDWEPQKQKKPTGRSVQIRSTKTVDGWELEPHVCRHCFGRICSRQIPGDLVEYQCTNCGAQSKAIEPSMLCACGIKLHTSAEGKRVGPANRDAGIRCIANPKKSPQFPAEYVATYVNPKERSR
jgi:hypothetical protein